MLFIKQGQQENINSGYTHTFSGFLGFFLLRWRTPHIANVTREGYFTAKDQTNLLKPDLV